MQRLLATLQGQQVGDPAQGTRAIEYRAGAPNHFHPRQHLRVNGQGGAHFAVVGELVAVDQDCAAAGILAADADALEAGLAGVTDLDSRQVAQQIGHAQGLHARQLLAVEHADAGTGFQQPLRDAAGGHHDLFQQGRAAVQHRPGDIGGQAGVRHAGQTQGEREDARRGQQHAVLPGISLSS